MPRVIIPVKNTPQNSRTRKSKNSRPKGSAYPPPIYSTVQVDKVFRFRCTAAGTYDISFADLGDLHCFATGSTTAYQLARNVRLRAVEIWAREPSSGDPVTISCEFLATGAGIAGPGRVYTDTSAGPARPAHLWIRPPRTSAASLWQGSGNQSDFMSLVLPDEATIDVHYSYTMYENTVSAAVVGTVTGATAGTVYVRALNSSVSATALPPISYQTI